MNELIKIENKNGTLTVSSRVVAEALEKQHSHVMQKCKDVLGLSEYCESYYINEQNKKQPELHLTKDGFILLCMNYQGYNEFKRAYINRFNEMEKALVSKAPTNMIEALTLALEQQKELERQKPLVQFAETVTNAENAISIGEFAKIISDKDFNIGQKRLFEWLRENNYLMKGNVPYQQYIDRGYFKTIEQTYNKGAKQFTGIKTLVTGKGQVYFTERIKKI